MDVSTFTQDMVGELGSDLQLPLNGIKMKILSHWSRTGNLLPVDLLVIDGFSSMCYKESCIKLRIKDAIISLLL